MLAQEAGTKQIQSLPKVFFKQDLLKEKKTLGILPPLLFTQDPCSPKRQLRTFTGNAFSGNQDIYRKKGLFRHRSSSTCSDSEDEEQFKSLAVTGTVLSRCETNEFNVISHKPPSNATGLNTDYMNYKFHGQAGYPRGSFSISGSKFLHRLDKTDARPASTSGLDPGTLFGPGQYSHEQKKPTLDSLPGRQSKSLPGTAMYRLTQESKLKELNEGQLKSLQGALFSLITSVACPSAALSNAPSPLTMSTSQHLKIHYGTSNMRCLRADRGRDRVINQVHPPKLTMPTNKEPTFYIGGGNGVSLINDAMEELGWRRIKEKNDDNFKLKWCELKTAINYGTFKEGDQMVNHIPNCQLLTNKMGLLNSLTEYEKWLQSNTKKSRVAGRVKLADFIPETYKLDDPRDREAYFNVFKDGEWWICKPTGRNQGKGIFISKDVNEIRQLVQEHEGEPGRPSKPINRVIQRYIKNPLLLDKRKFDIRAYMLIANMVPYLVLYHKGYVRLSLNEYDNDADNLITHLTNQFIQKKDPLYKENKEETAWSMDRFNDYINEYVAAMKGLPDDWVFNVLEKQMKDCMLYSFNAVKNKLQAKCGFFDLYGYDFMVDEDMKIYLIEVNINPCLATNCEALKDVVPGMVKEALYVSIECFEKARKNKPLLPLQTLNHFEIMYNASKPSPVVKRSNSKSPVRNSSSNQKQSKPEQAAARSRSVSPQRRPRSLSPVKEAGKSTADDSKHAKSSPNEEAKSENTQDPKKTGKDNKDSPKRVITRKDWVPGATALSPNPVSRQPTASRGSTTTTSARARAMTSSTSTIDPATSPYAVKVSDNVRLRKSHSSTGLSPVKRVRSKTNATKSDVASPDKEQPKQESRRPELSNRGS